MQTTLTAPELLLNNSVQHLDLPIDSGMRPSDDAPPIKVIRRDGSWTSLNISKIRNVVQWACSGKKANSIALEAGLTTRLRHGITTREIQDNLINCALEMCNPEQADWRYVAGRLHIWSLWKDTLVSRGYHYGDYARTVRDKVEAGEYDERLLNYSAKELQEASTWINSDWDTDYDYAGAVLLTSRYLLPDELPQEAYLSCALLLALVESPPRATHLGKTVLPSDRPTSNFSGYAYSGELKGS